MPRESSRIPVGTQFSPNLISLPHFLSALVKHSKKINRLIAAVWAPPVNLRQHSGNLTARRQRLPLEAAKQYGLLDDAYGATDLCRQLDGMDERSMYRSFARHILLNLGGLRVVEAVQQMQHENLTVSSDSLAAYLTEQGFFVAEHNTAVNSLRMWLAKAGLFPERKGATAWRVNSEAKEELTGLGDADIAALLGLAEDQREFLLALCAHGPCEHVLASQIRDLASTRSGLAMSRGSLPKRYLEPLQDMGLITFSSRGTSGGKASLLSTTMKFDLEVLEPFLNSSVASLDGPLAMYYRKSLDEIFADMESPLTHVKGTALEAFAIQIMRLLGLRFVAWRKRAREETGQAEVDALLAGMMGGLHTRWQVQCKNTPSSRLSLEDVAKEVGIAVVTKASHVLFVANCRVTQAAMDFAHEVMRNSSLNLIILDADDFRQLRDSPAAIGEVIRAKSRAVGGLM